MDIEFHECQVETKFLVTTIEQFEMSGVGQKTKNPCRNHYMIWLG